MQFYTAGWALQNPALNYFKTFLKINDGIISTKGIIYPKKIPSNIENISILDFQDVLNEISTSDTIIDCIHPINKQLAEEIYNFLQKNGFTITSISDFIANIIENDSENLWKLPFHEISTADIREIQKTPTLKLLSSNFLDHQSYEVALALDTALRNSLWEGLLAFDKDETLDQAVLESLTLMQKICPPQIYHILDNSVFFLNELIKLQQIQNNNDYKIILGNDLVSNMGDYFKFYAECFKNRIFNDTTNIEINDETKITYLSKSAQPIINKIQNRLPIKSAIFIMQRSIIDYYDLVNSLGKDSFRVALRQPDTQHTHLVASLIT